VFDVNSAQGEGYVKQMHTTAEFADRLQYIHPIRNSMEMFSVVSEI
jgi:hypothetical protein